MEMQGGRKCFGIRRPFSHLQSPFPIRVSASIVCPSSTIHGFIICDDKTAVNWAVRNSTKSAHTNSGGKLVVKDKKDDKTKEWSTSSINKLICLSDDTKTVCTRIASFRGHVWLVCLAGLFVREHPVPSKCVNTDKHVHVTLGLTFDRISSFVLSKSTCRPLFFCQSHWR